MRALCLVFALFALPAAGLARTTVAVVPFATVSSEEYQWVGYALAGALSTRVAQQPDLNSITLRQIASAMRQDNIEAQSTSEDAIASRLGKLVGADLILVGTYTAAWPSISIKLKAVNPVAGKATGTYELSGDLDQLVALEAQAATLLAQALGAEHPDVTPGAFGTHSLRAWREATLARSVLDWQSLSPTAADPKAQLALPRKAIEQARDQALAATKYDDDFGEAWASLGIAQALLGDTKGAWKSFGKATALGFGHHPTAVLGASFVRMREGRFDEAAEILRSAVARHPGFLHARGYLGELFNHLGRYREAVAVFDGYLEVAPRQPWGLAQRGYTKSRLNDHRGAIADTVAAVDMVPDSPSLLIQLASRYIDAGKLIGAEDALLQALKLFPEEARVYVRLGYVYLLQDKDDLAIPISEKALVAAKLGSQGHDRAYAHLNLARAYGHKGDIEKAIQHLSEAKAAGLPTFAEVEGDPKLAALRRDPRYKSVVN